MNIRFLLLGDLVIELEALFDDVRCFVVWGRYATFISLSDLYGEKPFYKFKLERRFDITKLLFAESLNSFIDSFLSMMFLFSHSSSVLFLFKLKEKFVFSAIVFKYLSPLSQYELICCFIVLFRSRSWFNKNCWVLYFSY